MNKIMQNKANLPNVKMNITFYLTNHYKDDRPSGHRQNKPNQTQKFLPKHKPMPRVFVLPGNIVIIWEKY